MTVKKVRVIKGKRYTRYNSFKTRKKAEEVMKQLKFGGKGIEEKKRSRWLHFDNVRIIVEETNKVRPFTVYGRGKWYSYGNNPKRKFH